MVSNRASPRHEPYPQRWFLILDRQGTPGVKADASADVFADIARLLDDAHRGLGSSDLGPVLVAVGRAIAPLRRGQAPAGPDGVWSRPSPSVSPEARSTLRAIRAALFLAARSSDPVSAASDLAHLGRRIDEYLDELAARPKAGALAVL